MSSFKKLSKTEVALANAVTRELKVYMRYKYAEMIKEDPEIAASDSFLYEVVARSTMVLARQLGNVLSLTISDYGGSITDFEVLLKTMWPGLRKEMMKGFSSSQWEQVVKQLKQ